MITLPVELSTIGRCGVTGQDARVMSEILDGTLRRACSYIETQA